MVSFQSTPTSVGRSLSLCVCGDSNCSRLATAWLGIDTLFANILVFFRSEIIYITCWLISYDITVLHMCTCSDDITIMARGISCTVNMRNVCCLHRGRCSISGNMLHSEYNSNVQYWRDRQCLSVFSALLSAVHLPWPRRHTAADCSCRASWLRGCYAYCRYSIFG